MEQSHNKQNFTFNGAIRNRIMYNQEQEVWHILDLVKGIPLASRNDSQGQGRPPLGTHSWFDTSEKPLKLSLTTCGPGEFGCSNGRCILISSRCDNRLDCPDGEDESLCELVELRSSYMKDLPPLSNVSLAIHIIQIVDTKEQENTITVRFQLVLTWRDARLNFLNLQTEAVKNIVSPKESSRIWMPKVDIQNMLENVKKDDALVTVVRNQETLELKTRTRGLVRDHVYDGGEHTLSSVCCGPTSSDIRTVIIFQCCNCFY